MSAFSLSSSQAKVWGCHQHQVCPRAVLPVRAKPQLPKEKGREGIIIAKQRGFGSQHPLPKLSSQPQTLPAPPRSHQIPLVLLILSSVTKVSAWCNPLPPCSSNSPCVGWSPLHEGQAGSSRRCLEGRGVFQAKNRDGALGWSCA